MVLAVALDQLGVVEVVAGVEPDTGREPTTQLDLVGGRQQRHLDPVDLGGVIMNELDEGVRGRVHIGGAPVARELRVEHLAEPVQHDRPADLGEHGVVNRPVVLGRLRGGGQVTGRHHDHLGSGALDERDLLEVAGGHLLDGGRSGGQVVGAGAGGDPGSGGPGLGGAAGDQLLRRRPVQTHVPLGGVHRLGHTQAVAEQVGAERQGGVPVDGGRRTGDVLGVRIDHDVGRREGDPGLVRLRVVDPGARRLQGDLAERAVGLRQPDAECGVHAHQACSPITTRRPSSEDRRPASTSCSPRTPAARS